MVLSTLRTPRTLRESLKRVFGVDSFNETKNPDLTIYENHYVFALKTQQIYTAIEDIFTRIAKTFENSVEDFSKHHYELLKRMKIHVENIRPAVISEPTFQFLNRLRSFRHFIRHAYDFELDKDELQFLQNKINQNHLSLLNDVNQFQQFLKELLQSQ